MEPFRFLDTGWKVKVNFGILSMKPCGHNTDYSFVRVHVEWDSYWFCFKGSQVKRKRKRSDSVLWQKPIHQQKCQKGKVTTQTRSTLDLHRSNLVGTMLTAVLICSITLSPCLEQHRLQFLLNWLKHILFPQCWNGIGHNNIICALSLLNYIQPSQISYSWWEEEPCWFCAKESKPKINFSRPTTGVLYETGWTQLDLSLIWGQKANFILPCHRLQFLLTQSFLNYKRKVVDNTRGPKGHISCTWVQCATFLRNR